MNNPLEFRNDNFALGNEHFAPLTVEDGILPIICIEPRYMQEPMRIRAQTPGGLIGESHDRRLVRVAGGGQLGSLSESISAEVPARPQNVLCWHDSGCRYLGGLAVISGEQAQPSDITLDTLSRWGEIHNVRGVLKDNLRGIKRAAAKFEEALREAGEPEAELLDHAGSLYPDIDNIERVESEENTARRYAVNHDPYTGLDREALRASGVQMYHDGLGATMANLARANMSSSKRGKRLAAAMSRSAAVATVIAHNNGLEYHEIHRAEDGKGVRIEQPAK